MRARMTVFGVRGWAVHELYCTPRPLSLTLRSTPKLPVGLAVSTRKCRTPITPTPPPGPPSARNSPSAGSPPAEDSSSSGEPLGLGEGEEFILVKVSHTKKKCWATFFNDDPGHQYDGHGHFALSASVEDILERRRQHHAILDMEARKKARQAKSPDRDYGFSNLDVQEQGEKPSPGLRQAAKSTPRNIESSSSETLNPDWEGRAENVWRAETESWGTPLSSHPRTPTRSKSN
jgi:hypothetical protein